MEVTEKLSRVMLGVLDGDGSGQSGAEFFQSETVKNVAEEVFRNVFAEVHHPYVLKTIAEIPAEEWRKVGLWLPVHGERKWSEAIVEILLLYARRDGWRTAKYISEFKIADPEARAAIAKLCAEKNGAATAEYIKNFDLSDQTALAEIALLCAESDGWALPRNMKNFGLRDPAVWDRVFSLSVERYGNFLKDHVRDFGAEEQEALNRALRHGEDGSSIGSSPTQACQPGAPPAPTV